MRTRAATRDSMLDALEHVIETSVQQLCEWIDEGGSEATDLMSMQRTHCAAMLNKLPLTCQALNVKARQDARFAAVMFYERTRLGATNSGHFLEGLARGLPLFTGNTTIVLPDDDLRNLRLRDVIADRIRTVASLEKFKNGAAKLVELTVENRLTDLPPGLPGRVHIFIARMRSICQGLQRVKTPADFAQCQNRECNRAFYVGQPLETVQANFDAPAEQPQDYWSIAAGSPCLRCEQRSFCTWSCCEQWKWQLSAALPPVDAVRLATDQGCRKEGRARVPEALRSVLKRNEVASRHLRTIEKERRVFPAVSNGDIIQERARRVRMYNVDAGMLYAASLLAEAKTLSTGKILPGASEGWRSRPMFYARALRSVAKVYDLKHTGGGIVYNLFIRDPFFDKLKREARSFF